VAAYSNQKTLKAESKRRSRVIEISQFFEIFEPKSHQFTLPEKVTCEVRAFLFLEVLL